MANAGDFDSDFDAGSGFIEDLICFALEALPFHRSFLVLMIHLNSLINNDKI